MSISLIVSPILSCLNAFLNSKLEISPEEFTSKSLKIYFNDLLDARNNIFTR